MIGVPLPTIWRETVRGEWCDYNGHLNMAYYVLICDSATFNFWNVVNGGRKQEERGGSEYAVVEAHVNYLDEVRDGDDLGEAEQRLLQVRLHVLLRAEVVAVGLERQEFVAESLHLGLGFVHGPERHEAKALPWRPRVLRGEAHWIQVRSAD